MAVMAVQRVVPRVVERVNPGFDLKKCVTWSAREPLKGGAHTCSEGSKGYGGKGKDEWTSRMR